MSRFQAYINNAAALLDEYPGNLPFAAFARPFFAANKKYGSKDRKIISTLCYQYFRTQCLFADKPIASVLLQAHFLCEQSASLLLEKLQPEWNEQVGSALEQKLEILGYRPEQLFPHSSMLSKGIDPKAFALSLLQQPQLFLRIRPQVLITTQKKLHRSKLPFQLIGEDAFTLPHQTDVESHFILNKEVVVQDYHSQQVLNYLGNQQEQLFGGMVDDKLGLQAWDCCAASGGKSILLRDRWKGRLALTVSDIRPSIMLNLHQRFKKAGIKDYQYFIADISDTKAVLTDQQFQLILCDAPCSGSGTWSRTPEQLKTFHSDSLELFHQQQVNIASNVVPHLCKNGILIYITCSVFAMENERVVDELVGSKGLTLLHQEIFQGYQHDSDSMFVAYLRK